MLSVILLILKIIGIVLLSILGLVIFLILLVLCVPIRYRLKAYKGVEQDDYYGKLNISFLLHIISVWVTYTDELNIYMRLLGIKIYDRNRKKLKEESKSYSKPEKKAKNKKDNINEEKTEEEQADVTYTIDWNDENEGDFSKESINDSVDNCNGEADYDTKAIDKTEPEGDKASDYVDGTQMHETKSTDEAAEEKTKIEKITDKIKEVCTKILGLFDKGVDLSDKIVNKIDELSDKYNNFTKMTNDYRNRKAVSKIWSQVKYLIVNLVPKKAKGRIHFGFDDPATTGQILVYLGVCAPFLPGKISYEPDFEENVIDGDIYIKGRFALVRIIIVLCKLYFDKNVRRLWKLYRSSK